MDRHGVERVVELDLDRDLGSEQVESSGHGADDDRCPGAHDVARGSDGRQPGKAAVAHVLDAVHGLARGDLGLDRSDDEGREARGGGRERGGDGGVGDGEVVGRARDRLLRPRVEAVPVFGLRGGGGGGFGFGVEEGDEIERGGEEA